uniref:Uncharacterized protein n=1 Tax=viral metagenome TaxID=1070528 RepID=A0A6C0IF34_9ZZZZ
MNSVKSKKAGAKVGVVSGGRRKRSSKRRSMRGGMNVPPSNSYSDGASYGVAVHGSGPSQWARTFESGGSGPGVYTSVQGATVGGGGKKRSKKGGFWGQIINQALVPFSILGMQQTYRRNKRGGNGTKRKRR